MTRVTTFRKPAALLAAPLLIGGLFAVDGCANQTPVQTATDVSGDITVAEALLNTLEQGKTPTPLEGQLTTLLTSLQAVDQAYIGSTTGTVEMQALTTLSAAVRQVMADLPSDAAVQKYGALAETAIASAEANATQSLTVQAEELAATVLIDGLAGAQPTQQLARG